MGCWTREAPLARSRPWCGEAIAGGHERAGWALVDKGLEVASVEQAPEVRFVGLAHHQLAPAGAHPRHPRLRGASEIRLACNAMVHVRGSRFAPISSRPWVCRDWANATLLRAGKRLRGTDHGLAG